MGFDSVKHERLVERVEREMDERHRAIAGHHWRDRFHYTPKAGWINDPCGLVQFKGKYHLFAQHHPYSGKWGQMHWAHAVSDDMIHWRHLPEALAPSEAYDDWKGGGIFTGSAVEHEGKLVLFYTACAEKRQTQCMAISEDGLRFEKFSGNPVLGEAPAGMNPRDFRDPKVWKHGDCWYMVTGTTAGSSVLEEASTYGRNGFGKIALHRSSDLVNWDFVNYPVESRGELGTMLECPNLFELEGKFVMMFSPMGLQERQVVYLTGDFDYETGKLNWSTMGAVDWGFDFYAPQFFRDDAGRAIVFGWAGSWPFMPWCSGEFDTADLGWYGSITLPRTVSMCSDGKLSFAPAREVERLRKDSRTERDVKLGPSELRPIRVDDGNHCEILADFDLNNSDAERIGFEMKSKRSTKTRLVFDLKRGNLIFDRTRSGGISAFKRQCPLESVRNRLQVRIFIDSATIEVFTDEGRTVMTNTVYSGSDCDGLFVFAENGAAFIRSLTVHGIRPIGLWEK